MKIILIADEGKILTDGKNYGSTMDIGEGRTVDEYSEITQEEYQEIIEKTEEQSILESE